MCDCIKITYLIPEGVETTIEINVSGTFGGANYYYWTDGVNDFIYFGTQINGRYPQLWEVFRLRL